MAAVVPAWPRLPDALRAGIVAMVKGRPTPRGVPSLPLRFLVLQVPMSDCTVELPAVPMLAQRAG